MNSKENIKMAQTKIKKKLKNIKNNILKNKHTLIYMFVLFIISTSYFLYQNINNYSWDFVSYLLNYEYLFQEGNYFEILRPPMMPFLLGVLSFLNIFNFETRF